MPPGGRSPQEGSRGEDAITPVIGTMLVFVIIFGGMAGALVFGVPAINGLQDRAAVDDMATQFEAVRREAERLTAEGVGSSVSLAPTSGSISLENGTRMAVAISFDGTAAQQGLALAWGKGGKKKAQQNAQEPRECDFHVQDWADGDNKVTMVMDPTKCQHPMLWNPSDAGSAALPPRTQRLNLDGVEASLGWLDASMQNLVSSDTLHATSLQEDPDVPDHDLRTTMANPVTGADTPTKVVLWANVSVLATSPADGFVLGACIGSGTTSCMAANKFSDRAGASQTEVDIWHDITSLHPGGNQVTWSWSDITSLQPIVRLDQQGGSRDGTYRVNSVWVVVTSGSVVVQNDAGKCYESSANPPVACLQGFKVADNGVVNRITLITDCDVANPPAPCPTTRREDTYVLTLQDDVQGDWYFQLSNDPRSGVTDTVLAKAYIFDMDRLRWVRDQGLSTWLEGGAVFASRADTQYLHEAPIIREDIVDTAETQPTYYLRIIRFQGDHVSISGTGTTQVFLEHNDTQSTANDGVSVVRYDFAGEHAALWCRALVGRTVPDEYAYTEHPSFPCTGGGANGVRSLRYMHHPVCPAVNPDPAKYNNWPAANDPNRDTSTACIKYKLDARFFQIVFTEVRFDVTLLP